MKPKERKRLIIVLACALVMAFVFMALANSVQTAGGAIAIEEGFIDGRVGKLAYKLYKPAGLNDKGVNGSTGAPGVLLLHGYQNDHETCAAYAIELARRGAVVLCIDEYGHGKTPVGLAERGYVNKKISVNFGEDSEADGTFKTIGGTPRYRLLMNFSNLSFFNDRYTKDDAGNSIKDSAEGGIEAYLWLAQLPYVDGTRLAVSGHSMGTWASWSVAAAMAGYKLDDGTDITPKATVLQCGELFRESAYDTDRYFFNNVLLLQAKYDEFSYFRDYKNTVSDDLPKSALRCEFLGTTPDKAAWNTTYGSFEEGTARRMQLLNTNHRLTTHHKGGLAVAIAWFETALNITPTLLPTDQTAMWKEWATLAALLCCLTAAMAFMTLLLQVSFFAPVVQPLPPKNGIKKAGKWWKSAVISMLIGGLLYPFATQLGHALVPVPENIFRMTVGNGLMTWYLFVIVINIAIIAVQRRNARKKGRKDTWYDRGLSTKDRQTRIDWDLVFRSLVLAFCTAGLIYICVVIFDAAFGLDLRIIWPMLGTFNGLRLGQFFTYILVFALYFVLVNSNAMAVLRSASTYEDGVKGFLKNCLRSALVMCGGIILIVLIEYIPFFAGIGPGADLLFSSTFGGPFMSLMILLLPQIVVYSVLDTYCYRKTGNVYTGGFLAGILACWIVTGGSSFM